jgi:hypothetical protein
MHLTVEPNLNLEHRSKLRELPSANGMAANGSAVGSIIILTSLVTASKLSNCPCGFKSAK